MLICNGKILTMSHDNVVYNHGYLWIKDGKITDVGDMSEVGKLRNRNEERILDVSGAIVMPGLIDAHAHIGISEEKRGTIGDDCNEMTNPVTPALRAIDAINPMDAAFHEAIAAGVTGVLAGPGSANVIGGQFAFLKTHGRCVDDMIVKAPAAMKAALGENPKVNYGDQNEFPSTRMAIAALLRKTLREAKEYNPEHGFDDNLEAMQPVIRKEIPLKVHVHRADDILTAIRIAKEFDIDITLDHCTEGHLIAEHIKKSGFPAIVGTDLTSKSKIEVANISFKTCGVLHKAGILTAITTDHPVALIQYLPICAGLSVKAGLDMWEGYRAITINAAKICRVDDRVGSLEVGKDADIAIFDGNPMETFTNTLYTIVDGEIVYDGRE